MSEFHFFENQTCCGCPFGQKKVKKAFELTELQHEFCSWG